MRKLFLNISTECIFASTNPRENEHLLNLNKCLRIIKKMIPDNFPRGGKKPLIKKPANLKNKKHRYAPKENEINNVAINENIAAITAESLTYTSLKEGMTILGRVHNVTEYDVFVSLPGLLSGSLNITEISEAYTNLLESLITLEAQPEEFRPLQELYKRGDYVVCYVKRINADEKRRVILTLEPHLINQNLDAGKLSKGSKIICSIASVEEHGYVVDTGLKNFRGFLSNNDVYQQMKFYPGQQILCAVKTVKTEENVTTAHLSTKKKHTSSINLISEGQPLDALVPGSKFSLTIREILKNGVQVTLNGTNIGYINRIHLKHPLESYEEGSQVEAHLLYVLPIVKFAYFTEIPLDEEDTSLASGNIVEKAKFLYRGSKGIVLELTSGIKGIVPFKKTGIDFNKIPEVFTTNSVHKCRILTYDIFDRIYICATGKLQLAASFKTPETLQPGDILRVKILRKNPVKESNKYSLFVNCGRIYGDISHEHISDFDEESREFKPNEEVVARVLSKAKTGEKFNFTLKKSLVQSELPILKDFADAKVNDTYLGTIIDKDNDGFLVKFYGDVKGRVSKDKLTKMSKTLRDFQIGQVVHTRIVRVDSEKKRLTLKPVLLMEKKEEIPFKIGESVEGIIVDSSMEGVHIRIFVPSTKSYITGYLPAGHMSPCKEMGKYLAVHCVPGDTLSALVFCTTPEFVLTRTVIPQEWYTDINNLGINDCIPCSIKEISPTGIKVLLPVKNLKSYAIVALNRVDDIKLLSEHQVLFGKILSINKTTKIIHLTTLLHEVWSSAILNDTDVLASIDALTLYLSKLKELSMQSYYQNRAISTIKLAQRVVGTVEKITKLKLYLRLENGIIGTVRKEHIEVKPQIGDKVNGTVLWIDYIQESVEITLNSILMNKIKLKQNPMIAELLDTKLKGEIVLVKEWFVLVVLPGKGMGNLVALPTKAHINELKPKITCYSIGEKVKCFVVLAGDESAIVPVCVPKAILHNSNAHHTSIKIEAEESRNELNSKFELTSSKGSKRNGEEVTANDKESVENSIISETKKLKKKEITVNTPEKVDTSNVKSSKRKLKENPEKSKSKVQKIEEPDREGFAIQECGFYWDSKPNNSLMADEESCDDEEETDRQSPKKKGKKLTASERRELERQKEREIREKEEALMNNQIPNSVDQFDRLVLSSPDSSLIWLQYMAYHLQATEIEKARAIAKRALKTINFREENEKLNVWQAWLNLESRFGTPETLNNVFQEALKANDTMKIYLHMLKVHEEAERLTELEKTVKTITAKFKFSPIIWIECGSALLRMGLKEKSRHTMQRALQSLPTTEHVNLMVQFAQLENKFGDNDRAQTLFENILISYPKRIDVWFTYVDSLIKRENIDSARNVLERAVIQTLSMRKMKSLFNKYVSFEEQYGTEETLAHAKELAVKYVENQCNKRTL